MRRYPSSVWLSRSALVATVIVLLGCPSSHESMVILNPSRHGERIVSLMLDDLEERVPSTLEEISLADSGRTPDLQELETWFQTTLEPSPTVIVAITDSSVEIAERYRDPDRSVLLYWAQAHPDGLHLQRKDRSPVNATGLSASLSPSAAEDVRLSYLLRFVEEDGEVLALYDPRDVDFLAGMERLEGVAAEEGVTLLRAPVESPERALAQIARFEEVEGVYLAPDRVIGQVAEELYEAAIEFDLPLAGPNVSSVRGGALLSYAFSEESVARALSELVATALSDSEEIGRITPQAPGYDLAFNLETAERLGLEVSDAFLQEVTILYRGQ